MTLYVGETHTIYIYYVSPLFFSFLSRIPLFLFPRTFLLLFFFLSSNSHPLLNLPLVMPRFTEQIESAVEALSANPTQPVDENEFIDASRLVYDGIRDIRKAVLMIRVSRTPFLFCCKRSIDLFFGG